MSTPSFEVTPYIREIGRGKEGSKSLTQVQARELFVAIFEGRVSDLQLGAILLALRVKGESTNELLGCMDAVDQSNSTLSNPSLQALADYSKAREKPVIVIPSYNGARRKPNFTPYLAGLLAKAGYPVLVHGLDEETTGRVTTNAIFPLIDWKRAGIDVQPVFLPLSILHPGLEKLMRIREVLGVRNVAHTLVKLLVPKLFDNSLLITSYTHPEFWELQRQVLSARGKKALVLRGHEGEAVAAPYRIPRMDGVKDSKTWCIHEGETSFSEQPDPKPDISAEATAKLSLQWLQDSANMPHGFLAQLKAVEQVVDAKV
ncbi:MAG: DNA-binding protein YbiB [Limnobacter sp.]|nr:DNA-binding protein YbiB [Limnobacter sp.]